MGVDHTQARSEQVGRQTGHVGDWLPSRTTVEDYDLHTRFRVDDSVEVSRRMPFARKSTGPTRPVLSQATRDSSTPGEVEVLAALPLGVESCRRRAHTTRTPGLHALVELDDERIDLVDPRGCIIIEPTSISASPSRPLE